MIERKNQYIEASYVGFSHSSWNMMQSSQEYASRGHIEISATACDPGGQNNAKRYSQSNDDSLVDHQRNLIDQRKRSRNQLVNRNEDKPISSSLLDVPDDVIRNHIVTHMSDPSDLARLRSVSKWLRELIDSTGRSIYEPTFDNAVKQLDLIGLEHLFQKNGKSFPTGLLDGRMYDEYEDNCCCPTVQATFQAKAISVMKYLKENGCTWSADQQFQVGYDTCSLATMHGHLDVLTWALENGCPWNDHWASGRAALRGRIDVLEWIYEKGYSVRKICEFAAIGNQFDTLRWAVEKGSPLDGGTFQAAIRNNNWDILEFCINEGCPLPFISIFPGSNIEILKRLYETGHVGDLWGKYTCSEAAYYGRLDILKWLRETGCTWGNEGECAYVWMERDIYEYCWENGCPWPSVKKRGRSSEKKHKLLKFLLERANFLTDEQKEAVKKSIYQITHSS